MKTLFLFLIAVPLILLSCTKDPNCDPGQLQTNIVGTWKVIYLGLPAGEVEFRANGDFVSDPNSLAGAYFGSNSPGQKSYVVNSNSSLTVTVTYHGSVQTTDVEFTDYTCDQIVNETPGGTQLKLKRKD